ncbi:MAG: thioesterase [Herpetosiphonaceae bacterium]|nr:MAG: thioesterase [Herpetosiphonaceae bacterium]
MNADNPLGSSGKSSGITSLRVRYADTDAMGVAYHANYLIWFEQGRTEFLRQAGISYRELEAQGYLLPVSEVQARFIAPARYDDLLTVKTTPVELRSRRLVFDYEIVNEQGRLLVSGRSTHIVVDRDSRRPTRLPQAILELLQG